MSTARTKLDVYKLCGYLIPKEALDALQFGEMMSLRLQWRGYDDGEVRSPREQAISDALDVAINVALGALGAHDFRDADGEHWLYFKDPEPAVKQMYAQISRVQFRLARELAEAESLADVEYTTPCEISLAKLSDVGNLLGYQNVDDEDVKEVAWWETFGVNTFEEFKSQYCTA